MHIKKLTLHRFKQFKDSSIALNGQLSLVVGGNNSGKSSLLQALATWQFCKTLIEIEKGRVGWLMSTKTKSGIGMGMVDFTPLQVPTLNHLWTNLKTNRDGEPDGYTLKIGVHWDLDSGQERHLEIGLSLVNDRLFVKTTSTNLARGEILSDDGEDVNGNVPRVAYLPPFAGITDREVLLTPAMRERLIGQGLSGGVIRNALHDMEKTNRAERARLRDGKTKIKNSDLRELRLNDSWEILLKTVQQTFATEIRIIPFNERYHSYLRVECAKGKFEGPVFKRHPNYTPRDLMVEGSGFLQWLSVYTLALSREVDVMLLDEPDAHLNATLQKELVGALQRIAAEKGKQVLLATHSPELIRYYDYEKILAVVDRRPRYLADPSGKVRILAGIGTVHTPTLHALMESRRMLIVEGESDERFLKILARRAGMPWPDNLVCWFWTGHAAERRKLFLQLLREIPGLMAISIRDRDDESDGTVSETLIDGSNPPNDDGFTAMKWRRRHVENYLLSLPAIERAAGKPIAEVREYMAATHALALPDDTTGSDIFAAVRDARGKEIFTVEGGVCEHFGISRDDVAEALAPDEVAQDIKTFLTAITAMAALPI